MRWSEDQIELLTAMWAKGDSSRHIAGAINCATGSNFTRNAVIGKAGRLGLDAPQLATGPRKKGVNRPVREMRVRIKSRLALVTPPKVLDEQIPESQRIRSLFKLENHHCRWPVGEPDSPDFFYCGDPTADLADHRPYCATHAALAFQKPTKPVKRKPFHHVGWAA